MDEYVDARVGREPLEPTYRARDLAERLATRRAPVKAAILDQRTVAGIGNIYADEALWRARIHPLTPARDLTHEELRALHRGIRRALEAGIARQGSTLRDYALPDGAYGTMQDEFRAYGRSGHTALPHGRRRGTRPASCRTRRPGAHSHGASIPAARCPSAGHF